MASGFLFNGAAAQHRAKLFRQMRITALAVSDFSATALSIALGIALAALGFGYWSLAAIAVFPSIVGLFAVWSLTGWIPDLPRRVTRVLSMLKYGSPLMFTTLLIFFAPNIDNALLRAVFP